MPRWVVGAAGIRWRQYWYCCLYQSRVGCPELGREGQDSVPPPPTQDRPQRVGLESGRLSQSAWQAGKALLKAPRRPRPPPPPSPRYISLLPVIPVTLRLNPREALEGRHPQDGRSAWPPRRPGLGGPWEAGPRAPGTAQAHGDVTLYK